MKSDDFAAATKRLRAHFRSLGLTDEELDRCMEPYATFLATMRDNDREDAERVRTIGVRFVQRGRSEPLPAENPWAEEGED